MYIRVYTLYSYCNLIFCSVLRFHFGHCLCHLQRLFYSIFCTVNHVNVVEWADTHGIHHWMILRSSFRKLIWVGFECHLDTLTDGAIRPRVQLTLRATVALILSFIRLRDFLLVLSSVTFFILFEILHNHSHECSGIYDDIWFILVKLLLHCMVWVSSHMVTWRW